MSKIKVIDDSYCCQTIEGEDEGEFSYRGETNTYHEISGITKVGENAYYSYDLEVPFDVKVGGTYALVYVIYSTGDSFGYDYGNIEFIDMFKNIDLANELQKKIEKNSEQQEMYRNNSYLGTQKGKRVKPAPTVIMYENEVGDEIKLYTYPWTGYFEQLESVNCVILHCKKDTGRK